jgi:hypothetical protein
MKGVLALLLLISSATVADASMRRCTEPASLVRMTTYFHVRRGELAPFVTQLHHFASSEAYLYSRATAGRSRKSGLDVWLVIRNTGPAIHVRSSADPSTLGKDMIVAELAECRNDTQTPWLPYWTGFYRFVQRAASQRSGARR